MTQNAAGGTLLRVPGEYASIQAAINAASDGDTIILADGAYSGDGFSNIDLGGKAVTIESENGAADCIVDCGGEHSCFVFQTGETQSSVVRGLTLRGGAGTPHEWSGSTRTFGGAVFCDGAGPTIEENIIEENHADLGGGIGGSSCGNISISDNIIRDNIAIFFHGGGIYFRGSSGARENISRNTIQDNAAASRGGGLAAQGGSAPLILNNTIADNLASSGGGVYISNGAPVIRGNLIVRNEANGTANGPDYWSGGGGLRLWDAPIEVTNNHFVENSATVRGGAVFIAYTEGAEIMNSVFSGNTASEGNDLYIAYYSSSTSFPSTVALRYSLWEDGFAGSVIEAGCALVIENVLHDSPGFVGDGSYYLTPDSACIDRGLIQEWMFGATDVAGNPRILNGFVDIGAYEFWSPTLVFADGFESGDTSAWSSF
ncbi:MAG: hypothetical protein GY720_21660 [bacterium]|nr:hypothetical protein [bacterium]